MITHMADVAAVTGKLAGKHLSRVLMVACCLLGLLTEASAAAKPKNSPKEAAVEYVWPEPPAQPVIRFLREFNSESVLEKKAKKSSWKDALLGKKEDEERNLRTPYGVHVDKRGRVLVADTNLRGLAIFDFENSEFSMLGDTEPGLLNQPINVVVDRFERIYVSDGRGRRVAVYDANGKFLNVLGGNDEFERPVGLAVDNERERVYVSDTLKHHVAVFDFDGKRISTIGERGMDPGQFNFPINMTIDAEGRLYIVDSMNFRVQVIGPDGETITTIGQQGMGPGQFARPKGIAIDPDGNIHVSDAAFNRIQMFNFEGALLLAYGQAGAGPGEFQLPAGLATDTQGRIYLADQKNQRIQVFQYLGKPSSPENQDGSPVP